MKGTWGASVRGNIYADAAAFCCLFLIRQPERPDGLSSLLALWRRPLGVHEGLEEVECPLTPRRRTTAA